MNIRIVDGPVPTSAGMIQHINNRLSRAMSRFGRRVGAVEVHLADINGPRGGIDKRCSIVADVRPSRTLVVENTREEFYAAIDGAISKLKRAMSRAADRAKRNGPRRA